MSTAIAPFIEASDLAAGESKFATLRSEGITAIQQYAGEMWTDHNYHDPGITALEAFCYALTEQDYLNNLSIEEIYQIFRKIGNLKNDFFSREKVLFNSPVTTLDWKKWLIDFDAIRNAWLLPVEFTATPPVFLTNNQYNYTAGLSMNFKGLYNVLLEWAPDPVLKELNGNIISIPLTIPQPNGTQKKYWADLIFPFTWDTTDPIFKAFLANMNLVSITLTTVNPLHPQLDPEPGKSGVYFSDLVIVYDLVKTISVPVILRISTEMTTNLEKLNVENAFIALLANIAGPVATYNKMMVKAYQLSLLTKDSLLANRNLAEDFVNLIAVNIQEIGIECELELTPGTAIEPLLAELFFVLDAFISPDFIFSDYTDDEINSDNSEQWEGPRLVHGYLSTNELRKTPGRSIFLSDLLHLMLEGRKKERNEKIIAVYNLSIQSYIDNSPTGKSEENCIRLLDDFSYRPRLNIFKSHIEVRQRGVDTAYDISNVYNLFSIMKNSVAAPAPPPSLAVADESAVLLDEPSYYPVQFEFPSFYQLSVLEKTPVNVQMRGYLLFFEQLLANQLSLLKHSTDLLSITNIQQETRFPQNIRTLLPFYNDYLSPGYEAALQTTSADNFARKSLLLDHLIARMGEDFRYYAVWNKLTGLGLTTAKQNYLKQLPELTSDRFCAFNYSKPSWNTNKTPAIHKKLTHLLQLPDDLSKRRWKTPVPNFSILTIAGPITLYGFRITDALNAPLLRSVNDTFQFLNEAQDAATSIIQFGSVDSNYQVLTSGLQFQIAVLNNELEMVALSENLFPSLLAAQAAITSTASYLKTVWMPDEGLHILELILLRPQAYITPGLTDNFLHIPVQPDNSIVSGFSKDVYSQQVLVVMPGAGPRFGDPVFQEVTASVIQREFPAGVQVRVAWLNIFKMNDFETAYEQWVTVLANPAATEAMIQSAKSNLINAVNDIYKWIAETA